MKKVELYTKYYNEKLVCCCPVENKCSKDRNCELSKFYYDDYDTNINELMKNRSYKRVNGRIKEIR